MEKTKIDLYKSISNNNSITKVAVILLAVVSISAIAIIYLMHVNHDKYVYGLSKDNSLLPLELIDKKEVEEVYEKGHISHFIELFYTVNQYNYKDRIERSLWLIDDSGKQLYESYTKRGHYNKLIQSSSDQSVQEVKIVVNEANNFKAAILVAINKPNQKDGRFYKIIVEGSLVDTEPDYPRNPYGFIISNYRETEYTEMTK